MKLSRDAGAALVLTIGCAAYGLMARRIDLFPGQETEAFTPRTLPLALAVAGMLLGFLQLLRSLRRPEAPTFRWREFDGLRAGLLLLCMIGYGLLFDRLGFLAATPLFLATAFFVMGERRPLPLLAVPVGFAVAFWLVITKVLGLYLAPGSWLAGQGG